MHFKKSQVTVQILDKTFEPFISEDSILNVIEKMAAEINAKYTDKELIFLSVLNGSFMFASDLLKHISISCQISFLRVSSYEGIKSNQSINEVFGLESNIQNKHVIILEDIIDTGHTIDFLHSKVLNQNPLSLKVATLLFKPNCFKGFKKPDFIGFEIPDNFVVGYGLDYNQFGRNTREIYKLN